MFYDAEVTELKPGQKKATALVVLNPSESRRLLAKAVKALPEVKNAWQDGMIIIARGITNAYVSEELFNIKVEPKAAQSVGMVWNGITTGHSGPPPCTWHVIKNGEVVENADSNTEILNFTPKDVFIKGANAVDRDGNAGIYVASFKGGTIGMAWPVVTPRGSNLIIPVSLEKMVPSVIEAAKHTGLHYFNYSTGLPIKLIPVPLAAVVTEIEAFAMLAGVKAYHIGSGGVGGSEGSVHLTLEGSEEAVKTAFELVKTIKGEPPASLTDQLFVKSAADFDFDPAAQLATLKGI